MAEVIDSQVEEVVVVKEKDPLFSKKNRKLITDPLNDDNPITVQVLGICSALAVSVSMMNAMVMTIAVLFVLAFSNLTTSLIRNFIPPRIRMIVQLVIIATLVTVVNEVLKTYQFGAYKQLSVYIGLIITNCIIMGRLEAFAMGNGPWKSMLDGIGNGLGYGVILLIIAFFRELFGSGTVFGFEILGDWYPKNGLLVMPVSAMFLIGLLIWVHRAWNKKLVDIS